MSVGYDGTLRVWTNTTGVFTALTGAANPLNGIDVGFYSAPIFVDLDGDGDLDLVSGVFGCGVQYWDNTGGVFVELTGASNPLNGNDPLNAIDAGSSSKPAFVDLDGDGDLDLVIGNYDGVFVSYENTTPPGPKIAVNVAPVNDAPSLTGFTPVITFAENTVNATPQLLDPSVVFADGEDNFNGGSLTLSGLLAEDRASVRNEGTGAGQIGLSGISVTYGGVVIGTLAGGSGTTLTISFNADATSEAIDALIQNLTYANISNTPTADRTLVLNVTDATGADLGQHVATSFAPLASEASPVGGINGGLRITPSFGDLDGDGDLDLVAGELNGTLMVWTNAAGVFTAQTGAANPFDGIDVGFFATPDFVDLDGDGDLDLVVGQNTGTLISFENTTPRGQPIVVTVTAQNDAPVLTGFAPAITFVENTVNATPQLLDADVVFTDGEDNFNGGSLTLSGLLAEDRASVRNEGTGAGQIGLAGANVSYGGVVIGTLAGGAGATLTISFNAAATSAAIDALIQNLTYRNISNTPTAERTLALNVTDAAGGDLGQIGPAKFAPLTGLANPLNGFNVGDLSTPTFVDLDSDGDLDLVAGELFGTLKVWINSAGVFTTQTGLDNPFNGIDVGYFSSPTFVDLDSDGDLDLVVGERDGTLKVWTNAGGDYTAQTGAANPFDRIYLGNGSSPSFADLDGDSDLDLVAGEANGTLKVWTNAAGVFTQPTGTANPFNGIDVGLVSTPSFADLDGDGDLVVGENDGTLRIWTNAAGVFAEQTGAANPFDGIDVGYRSDPSFVDLDGDGDLDLVVGSLDGTLKSFENITPRGGQIAVTVTAQTDTFTGTSGNDTLYGTAGPDLISGLGGDDTLVGRAGADTVYGGAGRDRLIGGTGGGFYYGGDDDDIIVRGTGVSSMYGGAGTDMIIMLGFNDNLTVNLVTGQSSVAGESFQGFDSIRMGNGTNTVIGTTANNQIFGGTGSDTLFGGAGNDVLVGGQGIDRLIGGAGNDVFSVNAAGDQIVGTAGGGTTDRIVAYVSYVLAAGVEVEFVSADSAASTAAINLTGNALQQRVIGNAGVNRLDGKAGSDVIAGGAGADVFVFTTGPGASNIDLITDYSVADDRIEIDNAVFAGLAAGALGVAAFASNITGLATTATQRIIYETDTGFLWFDADGNGAGARVQFADLTGGLAMAASEFMVI